MITVSAPVRRRGSIVSAARLAPAAVYLGIRLLDQVVWLAMSAVTRSPASVALWDGFWYLSIGVHGYAEAGARRLDSGTPLASLVFFPLFPTLLSPLLDVGVPVELAPLLVVLPAGVALAYGVARLARLLGATRRGELVAVVLVAAAPMTIVFQLAYPEALFAALTAWALVAVLERSWVLAATTTLLAGLTRPTAVVLIAVVVGAGLVHWWRGGGRRALWVLVAPLGYVGYLAYVAVRVGRPDAYSSLQRQVWGVHTDGGVGLPGFVSKAFTDSQYAVWGPVVLASIALAVVGLVATRRALPVEVWAYAALIVFMVVLTAGFYSSKPRHLVMAFVLLLPLARWLDGRPRRVLVPCVIGWVLLGTAVSIYGLTLFGGAI